MKKVLIIFVISTILLFAQEQDRVYNISYNGISVGKIKDFSTINQGYLIGRPVNRILGFFVPWENYVIYEENKKPIVKGKNKYKKDKHLLLRLIKELTKVRPKQQIIETKKYKLVINCTKNRCDYKRTNKYKLKTSSGYLTFFDNFLKELYDEDAKLSFKRVK